MQDFEDAHGHLMYEFLKGRETYKIIEPDDGFVQVLPVAGYFSPRKKWVLNHRKAVGHVKGRVLDIGCGAGRDSIYNIEGNWVENQGFIRSGVQYITIIEKEG